MISLLCLPEAVDSRGELVEVDGTATYAENPEIIFCHKQRLSNQYSFFLPGEVVAISNLWDIEAIGNGVEDSEII